MSMFCVALRRETIDAIMRRRIFGDSGSVLLVDVDLEHLVLCNVDGRIYAVEDVCTIGVPNKEWGEEVKSVIMLKAGQAKSEALKKEILDFVRPRLAGFKMPRTVDFVEELPRSAAGKIQRNKVRAPYWEGRARQI